MVSIVICTNKGVDDVISVLRQVVCSAKQSNLEFEVILVINTKIVFDSIPSDYYRNISGKIKVLIEPKRGKSSALNCGIASAQFPYLLFTDDDCYVPIDWVSSYSSFFNAKNAVITGTVILDSKLRKSWMEDFHLACLAQVPSAGLEDNIVGANWAVRKDILDQVGSFDECLGPGTFCGLGEDTHVATKLFDLVGRFTVNTSSPVIHKPDISRLKRKQWLRHVSKISRSLFYIRHGKEPEYGPITVTTIILYAKYLVISLLEKFRTLGSPITARELTAYQRFYYQYLN